MSALERLSWFTMVLRWLTGTGRVWTGRVGNDDLRRWLNKGMPMNDDNVHECSGRLWETLESLE